MLRTRLMVGTVLILLVVGVLALDDRLSPWFPFLLALVFGLGTVACHELLRLLPVPVRPQAWLCHAGVLGVLASNWVANFNEWTGLPFSAWACVVGAFVLFVLAVFSLEMATFTEPGTSVQRMALAVWIGAYLGLLPSCLAQMRWLPGNAANATAALALAIFVPKSCDTGAYFIGRLLGRHRMTPVLSPKKTWEGAAGGLAVAAAAAVALDRLGPAQVLQENLLLEVGFGVTVGVAAMLGDLAESLVKRDCQQKDASQAVPGFGGVLDVVDSIIFAAPLAYCWLRTLLP